MTRNYKKENYPSSDAEYVAKYNLEWRLANPEKYLFRKAQWHSRQSSREFNIDVEDIKIPTHCPVLGIPIILGLDKSCDNSPSIDRFDSTKGYVKGNVNVISWRANRLKSDGTLEEFEKLIDWMNKNV